MLCYITPIDPLWKLLMLQTKNNFGQYRVDKKPFIQTFLLQLKTPAYKPKEFGGSKIVWPKFCDVSPNHNFLKLYSYEIKNSLKFRVKTKKKPLILKLFSFLKFCPKNITISKNRFSSKIVRFFYN